MNTKKIFIIEDDANILYSLQAKFSILGFQTKTHSGNEEVSQVIKGVKDFSPSFLVLDLILPKIDGFEIIKALRADSETADLVIFVFTNLSDQESREKGLNLGVNHYFIKNDFNVDQLVEKIKKIIKNREKI